MANNRYYLLCPCGKAKYLGKSLGRGIYNTRGGPQSFTMGKHEGATVVVPEQKPAETPDEGYARFLDDVYEWMWEHLTECNHPECPPEPVLGNEWLKGEIFKVITEYDERITREACE